MTQPRETGSADRLPEEGQQALSALRGLWSAQGQSSQDVESASSCGDNSNSQSCKATDSMTFEGLIDEVEATTDTHEAITNVQSAWRKKLEQDGKLHREGKALGDLVLGDDEAGSS